MTSGTMANEASLGDFLSAPLLGTELPKVQVQSVLYNTTPVALERALENLHRSVELAVNESGVCQRVVMAYGDCSPLPILDEAALELLHSKYGDLVDIEYVWFGENLGSAAGHNRIAADTTADFLMILNPDVVVSPRTVELLLEPFGRVAVGMTEAKQMPLEHPKDYEAETGHTLWCATACAMIPVPVFRQLDGFDSETFFLYCDDVDFSWRVRQLGLKLVFQPAATVVHDKRLTEEGGWDPTSAEHYFSAEASLLLMHKWSRPELVEMTLAAYEAGTSTDALKAAASYRERAASGKLPAVTDQAHAVGVFLDGFYAPHRYGL